ncbi:hypothetical protein NHX12_008331 [Muraenolepis orangiensis]|uniref:Ribosome biogenesis protein NOP53 n=1 Tax=Muraenolepis orangiensis TaxID=630683 RepID=A0A9Q0I9P7_9TELE|nr:hypothetical protein NHX12_008331 [Muraenolepis orangiensis]
MAAARRAKRVAALQPGFMTLKTSIKEEDLNSGRRKRVNKNKKKNWSKHVDVNDVEDFLEDVRLQERTTGGLVADKKDDDLFFLDAGDLKAPPQTAVEPAEGRPGKRKAPRPLYVDLVLKNKSLVPVPKDVLAYQVPNAKKLRRVAKKAEQLAAEGKVPKKHRPLKKVARTNKTTASDAPNNPTRDYYDMWGQEVKETRDPWFLQQTRKAPVKRWGKLTEKQSLVPAVEIIDPGGSYNPDFFSHQALLLKAHEVEVKKEKEEQKILRQLAVDNDDKATEETVFQEQVEGLEEEDGEDNPEDVDDGCALGILNLVEKKTEKQRKRERQMKVKEQRRMAVLYTTGQHQQLFQLRSIKLSLRQREQRTKQRQTQRRANQEAEKYTARRLGKLKFKAQDLEVQLTNELTGSLRTLKPEGSVLKDRFKSLQKRNLIEPRERAKFKPRLKVKYVEKRSFREIT